MHLTELTHHASVVCHMTPTIIHFLMWQMTFEQYIGNRKTPMQ